MTNKNMGRGPKIKICGLTSLLDIEAVNSDLPDYVGFVFAEGSRRQLSLAAARQLTGALSPQIQAVGVFVNQPIEFMAHLVAEGIIHVIQLHGEESEDDLQALQQQVSCPIIRSIPVGTKPPLCPATAADYLLFDTASAQRGGTGKAFDWALISQIPSPFFLAGGLNEENICAAIAALHPYAVDVSSGVETNGKKDKEKISQIIRLIREENIHYE